MEGQTASQEDDVQAKECGPDGQIYGQTDRLHNVMDLSVCVFVCSFANLFVHLSVNLSVMRTFIFPSAL